MFKTVFPLAICLLQVIPCN